MNVPNRPVRASNNAKKLAVNKRSVFFVINDAIFGMNGLKHKAKMKAAPIMSPDVSALFFNNISVMYGMAIVSELMPNQMAM